MGYRQEEQALFSLLLFDAKCISIFIIGTLYLLPECDIGQAYFADYSG